MAETWTIVEIFSGEAICRVDHEDERLSGPHTAQSWELCDPALFDSEEEAVAWAADHDLFGREYAIINTEEL